MAATIAIFREGVSDDAVARTVGTLREAGHTPVACLIGGRRLLIFDSDDSPALVERLEGLPAIAQTMLALDGSPLARRFDSDIRTVVDLGTAQLGNGGIAVLAGPCAVESAAQLRCTATEVARLGAAGLRGGAYKPRTSPYSFQGLGRPGLELLAEVGRECGLPVVTEAVDETSVTEVARYAQVIQIGARNAQNFALLRAVGRTRRPVLLKRGFGATVDEWLAAAEYILAGGNGAVILCERGIRSFERSTRFTLDLSAVPVVKRLSHLPIVVDPSHGTGRDYLVRPMALAAVAAGADGLLVDVHHNAGAALCDQDQALGPADFAGLLDDLGRLAKGLGRRLTRPASAGSLVG
ncbi:3-deoxy-7-phosphoheptulonate synthase [Plantactinospora sp. WMMB334]|uniref:3-deoxy-7-phosphoheptulonate synthase n=1 Tax=Plantactinospora sp. WMMB334 TaxID=3404119 RepID=UPI003B959004